MSEQSFEPPGRAARLHSGVAARIRRLFFWFRAWVLWEAAPTAAAYNDLLAAYQASETENFRLRSSVAVATAERDVLRQEVAILVLVIKRNEERVKAESARASADREVAVNTAAIQRGARASE